ncbi:polysaccharide pyruvyl transferase family protein [Providencia manganoxydans]|uniref:Polysaccharide pyruvyl transferase family protein n=1 Tax=Providencia manganoxydans TaxID=2923283 RepID=A0ABX7AEY6_9GAMM|nr:polysaccharide pyruvyl transferase family protein [Providencia manganoxydans]
MKSNIKKSVGVLTMHRVINYGSFLQAYATQKIVTDLGFKCEIIDYVFPNEWHYTHGLNKNKNLKKFISDNIYKLGLIKSHRKRKHINNAIKKYLHLSPIYRNPTQITNTPPNYDIYITGSDQTWNTKHTRGDTTFLLSFAPNNSKKISFSASIAGDSLDDVYRDNFQKYLRKYDAISIRDSNGNKVIEEMINRPAEITLDPTLILDHNSWATFASYGTPRFQESNYIVFYLITHSFDPTPYIYELLKKLQEKVGLKVYSFTKIPEQFNIDYINCSDICIEHFIQLFKNASFVVTSSFHGTAFSANFGIPMYSVVDDINNRDDRQASLLSKLGISNCLVPVGTIFENIDPTYNFEEEQAKLSFMREESIRYLIKNLV